MQPAHPLSPIAPQWHVQFPAPRRSRPQPDFRISLSWNLYPPFRLCTFRRGFEPKLVAQTIFEIRMNTFSPNDCLHEIRDGVHEGVFVTDKMTRRPPIFHKRMR